MLSTATKYPYSVTWTPANLGTYTITAQVTDNLGDKIDQLRAITVSVVPEPPPVISITAPSSGGIVTAGAGTTIAANAVVPDGHDRVGPVLRERPAGGLDLHAAVHSRRGRRSRPACTR